MLDAAAQVAALAELFGITPETHRWLAKKDYVYPNGCGHGNPRHLVGVRLDVSKLPDPLGPDADGVWLAPMLLWCKSKGLNPLVDSEYGPWSAMIEYNGLAESLGESPTAALLQACLAARVPEVCAAMEGER